MSDGITGEATYKCMKCGAKHFLKPDDFYFEAESGSERGMGPETQYIAEFDEPCHQCGNEINLKFEVWEYPVGIINYTNDDATGAEILYSNFDIYHRPPEDHLNETIELIKPLIFFRFDKFSELFVDFWLSSYKKSPTPTTIISLISIIIAFTSIGLSIYKAESNRIQKINITQNYTDQYSILKDTERNLNNLADFISTKKGEIETTQKLIESLEQKKSELEPIVNAHQEVIDAIFLQQKRELEKSIWFERGVSFSLGVLASLIASLIWHFIIRIRKKNESKSI